ncbi:MAG: hypothetical protein C4334_03745 [Pyrinomonas sp.]
MIARDGLLLHATNGKILSVSLMRRIRRAVRGDVPWQAFALEAWRRAKARAFLQLERIELARRREREARLAPEFRRLSDGALLEYFRARRAPASLPGIAVAPHAYARLFPREAKELIAAARRIAEEHRWPLLGFGSVQLEREVDWRRCPVSKASWPLLFHADVEWVRSDGADIRVLWELNRLGHLLKLACAWGVSLDQRWSEECWRQITGWRAANPMGYGPNWTCAMEVALRAVNLLAVFELLRRAPSMTLERLKMMLALFDEHGAYIRRNLEFSYLATSNHYLADLVGLLWLGTLLPELSAARDWRDLALRELPIELDKQILNDGADDESSTGYHRFVLEMLLYTLLLCRANRIDLGERFETKLRAMLAYVRAYLRPDGRAPLIGDTDGGQFLPFLDREADDHAYLLAIGAVAFDAPGLKLSDEAPGELFWTGGEEAVARFRSLPLSSPPASAAFPDAGVYIQRAQDRYLLFNATRTGLSGRGSHAHNDALSIEVSVCGRVFVRDPGSYVYGADLDARHVFRSTAFHSTVQVDDEEQNEIERRAPFAIGDQARPRLLRWEASPEADHLIAEHYGYCRLPHPVTHRRAVFFDKRKLFWLIEDALLGTGRHRFKIIFHFDAGLTVEPFDGAAVEARDHRRGSSLLVVPLDLRQAPAIESRWTSRHYGERRASQAAVWTHTATVPLLLSWALIPICAEADRRAAEELIARLHRDRFSVLMEENARDLPRVE